MTVANFSSLLRANGDALLAQGKFADLAELLAEAPPGLADQEPALLRLRANLAASWQHDVDAALLLNERARQAAASAQDWEVAARAAMDLARWHQSREEPEAARNYLISAEHYVNHVPQDQAPLRAALALAFGRTGSEFGEIAKSAYWCREALRQFEEIGDVSGQVDALWNLAVVQTYLAELPQARANVERALRLHSLGRLDPLRRLYLLNLSAHIFLYAGQTADGLAVVRHDAADLVQQLPSSKAALYLVGVEATLLRQAGDLAGALDLLARAEKLAHEHNDEGLLPEIFIERGWTMLLAGQPLAEVRRVYLASKDLHDEGFRRALNVHLAVVDVLDGRLLDAEARLELASRHFAATGERQCLIAIRFHQAYLYLCSGRRGACHEALEAGLAMADELGLDYFPNLWHPAIVASVCIEALAANIKPRVAELMILRHLGDAAAPGLMALQQQENAAARRRALSVLNALDDGHWLSSLQDLTDTTLREVNMGHLAAGRLALSQLDALALRLGVGDSSARWQRLAVFGYYAASDASRREIAETLVLSEGAVKKHIAAIRSAFGVESSGGRGDDGRRRLAELARAERFVLPQERWSGRWH